MDGPGTLPISVDYSAEGTVDLQLNEGAHVGNVTMFASVESTMAGFSNPEVDIYTGGASAKQSFMIGQGVAQMVPGVDYEVVINANIDLIGANAPTPREGVILSGDPIVASAFADPVFSIDPSNPDASAYSFEISPNIASVPETSRFGLLGVSFLGLVGILIVRRKPPRGQANAREHTQGSNVKRHIHLKFEA